MSITCDDLMRMKRALEERYPRPGIVRLSVGTHDVLKEIRDKCEAAVDLIVSGDCGAMLCGVPISINPVLGPDDIGIAFKDGGVAWVNIKTGKGVRLPPMSPIFGV